MAPTTTNYSEIQHDEIEVLRSIYMNDFVEEEAKTGAWKKAADRAFQINLRNQTDEEQQIVLTISVSLPPTYPKSLPRLALRFGDSVRQQEQKQAQEVIRTKPKSLLGSEMIFEIVTSLQDILDNNAASLEIIPTLDEERAARDVAARLKTLQDEEERRQQAIKAEEEEEQTLLEMVKHRKSQSTRRNSRSINHIDQPFVGEDVLGGVTFERPARTRNGKGNGMDTIYTVHQRVQYRQGPVSNVLSVQPRNVDQAVSTHENPPFLVLKECKISSTKRAIQNLESRLEFHTQLKSHQSIIQPLNFRIQRDVDHESSSSNDHGNWTIIILMKLAERRSLRESLEIVDKLDIKLVRAWSIRLIEGLQHYHRHGSAHASLHLGNVLLEFGETERGDRKLTVPKLSDGGYQRDLHLLKKRNTPRYSSIAWTAPEVVNNNTQGEAMPATDIWDFGLCFLQMAFGLSILSEYQSPNSLIDELKTTKSLTALLSHMFQNDPKKRPSAWDLLHFEFFRNDDQLLEEDLTFLAVSGDAANSDGKSLQRHHFRRELTAAPQSRYAKEFVEDGRLGRGGFGEVFKARNKVDGQPYAIKKVKARSKSALDPVLSEVTVLSRLNHPNVVRYFAAWIDDGVTVEGRQSDLSEEETGSFLTSNGDIPGRILPASSRGLDFISSAGANVIFGDDGEGDNPHADTFSEGDSEDYSTSGEDANQRSDDSEEESEPALANAGGASQRKRSDPRESATWTILYIQMEYCKPETLRDLINSGLHANAAESWRLFRQIVQGLVHIHAASIVHRDLKPENIFIDSNGDVRIGDFGLARPGDYRTSVNNPRTATREVFGSFTKDVGTASYVAPEVRSAGNGKYNEKADMYSLGVILLEMNALFSTGMERAETLEFLQKEEHALPLALRNPEKATQATIFMSLVQHRPSQRPSSSELLYSGQIPVQDEDESYRVARRLLTDRTSHFRSQFISSLFNERHATEDSSRSVRTAATDPMQAVTLLEDLKAMSRSLPEDLDLQVLVREKLTAIFHRHGVVERTDSPALFPYHSCYPSADVVQFLSPSGKVMQLPYDLILPNAMLLARHSRAERKTFVFDNVYRVDHLRDQTKIFGEANLDIVSENSFNLALREAEVLKVIDEILDAFPSLSSVRMCYHINHAQLLDAILRFCDIEVSKWSAVKETISKLHTGEWTWAKVRHELRGPSIAVAATSLDELESFDFRDTLEKAITRIRSIIKDTADLESAFAHMHAVTNYLSRFNIKRKVYLAPLSSYNEKFYRGSLLFQCLYDQKKRSVLAAGGRYDQLIRDHQPITSRKSHVYAVGFQLAWTGLCADMASYLKRGATSKAKRKPQLLTKSGWSKRRCDVLIDSFDQSLLDSVGVDILHELWSNSISAELAEEDHGNNAENTFAKSKDAKEDHSWVVLIKSEDSMKIKTSSRKDEIEVRLSDVTGHLRGEIRERDRLEGRTPRASTLYQSGQQDVNGPEIDREVDVKVLMSQNKGKKVNRKTIVEAAQQHKAEYLQNCADSPIVAIETKDDIFEGIIDTRLSDPESWKKFIQSAAPGERQYLGQLQDLLRTMAKESVPGNTTAIVYNFRTKACISYNLGKAS